MARRPKLRVGDLTYSRIIMAPMEIIDKFLVENGWKEYIGSSRVYIAERFRDKAKDRGRDYYL